MRFPGSGLHLLEPKKKGKWAVKVSGNWRITFKFKEGDAYEVDYVDYHWRSSTNGVLKQETLCTLHFIENSRALIWQKPCIDRPKRVNIMRIRKRPPAHPGRILRSQHLGPLSMTITDLAHALEVSRKTVSKIINERGSITPDMALRLSRALDTSPDLWLNLQKNYDLWHASHSSDSWKRVRPIKTATHVHVSTQ